MKQGYRHAIFSICSSRDEKRPALINFYLYIMLDALVCLILMKQLTRAVRKKILPKVDEHIKKYRQMNSRQPTKKVTKNDTIQ